MVLHNNQQMHPRLHEKIHKRQLPSRHCLFPPQQIPTPPLPVSLPVIKVPEYPEFLIHVPESNPKKDVHQYECDSSEPESENEKEPKTVEVR